MLIFIPVFMPLIKHVHRPDPLGLVVVLNLDDRSHHPAGRLSLFMSAEMAEVSSTRSSGK
jgi:TRAP-type C4-dicarboxylate transport system permease large subunit